MQSHIEERNRDPEQQSSRVDGPLSPLASLRALQRTAGNRAVRRLARRTSDGRQTREDALALAKDAARSHDLWNREHYLQARLTDPGETDRADQLQQLRAVEKLEGQTRIKQHSVLPREPDVMQRIADRKEAQRLVVWQNSAKTGLEWATRTASTPMAQVQVALLRQDLDLVKKQFRERAYDNAYKVLDASTRKIGDVLKSYGLMIGGAEDIVHDVSMGYWSSEKGTTEWLDRARTHDEYKAKAASRRRGDLGTTTAQLSELQKEHRRLKAEYIERYYRLDPVTRTITARPKDDEQAGLAKRVKAAEAALNTAWIPAERRHPILEAYRDEDVGELARAGTSEGGDDAARNVLATLVETLGNIRRAKLAIKQRKVSPLELGPIVALTRAQMLIRRGTYWDAAIADLIKDETDGNDFAKAVLAIVLAALSMLPGGQVFALLGMALDLYVAGSELAQYGLDKTTAGTDLDRAKALSDRSPSLAGFAWALVSAGLNAAVARSAYKSAETLEARIASGDRKAIEELNKLGDQHGIRNLGGETEARVLKERGVAEGGKLKPVGEAPPVRKPSAPKRLLGKIKSAVVKALKLSGVKTGMKLADLPPDYKLLLKLLEENAAVEGVARVRKAVPVVMDALRNPDLYGEVLAEAYARAVANNSDIVAELKAMARESGMTVVETPPRIEDPAAFYRDFAAQNKAIVDKAFTLQDHGEMMHIIQDLVVDRALNAAAFRIPNMPATSGTFRLWLQDLRTVVKFPDVLKDGKPMIDIPLGEAVWRSTYDLFDKAHLPTPEATMPKLRDALRQAVKATDQDLP